MFKLHDDRGRVVFAYLNGAIYRQVFRALGRDETIRTGRKVDSKVVAHEETALKPLVSRPVACVVLLAIFFGLVGIASEGEIQGGRRDHQFSTAGVEPHCGGKWIS